MLYPPRIGNTLLGRRAERDGYCRDWIETSWFRNWAQKRCALQLLLRSGDEGGAPHRRNRYLAVMLSVRSP